MSSTGRLDRGYGVLNTSQRVALAIGAQARDDDREQTRLWDRAPKEHYRGPEVAYVRAVDLAAEFATAFGAAELGPRWAALGVLWGSQHLIDELSPVEEPLPADAEARTPISNDPIDVLYALLERQGEQIVTAGAEQVHGFSAFCEQELNVEGSDMIAAFARPFVPMYSVFAKFEADPVRVAEISDAYRDVWRARLTAST
jgi:hypothetical protein